VYPAGVLVMIGRPLLFIQQTMAATWVKVAISLLKPSSSPAFVFFNAGEEKGVLNIL
jgi:hypothetical protein